VADIIFHEVAWLLLAASVIALIGSALRQPVVVSFIAVGIAAGALVNSSPATESQIEFLAELGITSLLFLVGLKLDWRLIRALGPVAAATGLGQVVFTSIIGFLIGLALGLDAATSLYVAVALTFSSTIIVVKLLTDRRELETLHGRIALGILIVQDLVVVVAMVALSAVGVRAADESDPIVSILWIVGSLAATAVVLAVFVRWLADPITARFARVPELLVIFAIGWAAAAAAVGETIGLGKEIGGLAAGVSLGSTPYREMISARLGALRDFLLLFFFLSLGATLDLASLGQDLGRAAAFSLFVLVGKPLIVIAIMAWMGYRARTGFLAGLTVAQISEFSLIFMAMALALGDVDESAVGLVTLVGLVTIAVSVYINTWSHQLYERAKPLLTPFDVRRRREIGDDADGLPQVDVILFGLGRFGSQLLRRLEDAGFQVLAVDLDPAVIRAFSQTGHRVRYGDVAEQEFWAELPLAEARWLILAVPYGAVQLTQTDLRSGFLAALRSHKFQGRVAMTARDDVEASRLAEGGVDLVLYPFDDAAAAAARQIADLDDPGEAEPMRRAAG
jgi:Kef-type K+ transport system membrane component KefB